jgi:hypothetical protein
LIITCSPIQKICVLCYYNDNVEGEIFEEQAQGDGQYDAFMNALKKVYKQRKTELPVLTDYAVRIPPGGKSDALCETIITWMPTGRSLKPVDWIATRRCLQ